MPKNIESSEQDKDLNSFLYEVELSARKILREDNRKRISKASTIEKRSSIALGKKKSVSAGKNSKPSSLTITRTCKSQSSFSQLHNTSSTTKTKAFLDSCANLKNISWRRSDGFIDVRLFPQLMFFVSTQNDTLSLPVFVFAFASLQCKVWCFISKQKNQSTFSSKRISKV